METLDAAQISKALIVWLGYGELPWPATSEQRLQDHFGSEVATRLLPTVVSLFEEFYDSDASRFASDLESMAAMASAPFAERHPDLTEEAVAALAWSYTYDFK